MAFVEGLFYKKKDQHNFCYQHNYVHANSADRGRVLDARKAL